MLMFIAALFTIIRHGDDLMRMDRGMDAEGVYGVECYCPTEQNEIMPSAVTRMDPEMTTLSEVNQKDKHCTSLTCGI